MTENQESELVLASKNGDAEAFGLLVQKYANALLAVAFSKVGDFHLAQDITQEAFIKAYNNLHHLNDCSKFGHWIITITKHLSIDWLRKRKNLQTLDELGQFASLYNLEENIIQRAVVQQLVEALQQIPDVNRTILLMYTINEFSAKEISQLLNLPVRTIEGRIRSTRKYLKKELYGAMEKVFTAKKLGEEFKRKVLNEVKGVVSIYVRVTNIDRSVQWYKANLGCAVKQKNDRYACLRLPWGPQLEIVLGDATSDHVVFGLYAPNVESYHSLLKENAVKLDEIIDQGDCGLLFNMYDPDGNKIEVWGGYQGGGKGELDNWIKSQQY